jgi:hypothetical protein
LIQVKKELGLRMAAMNGRDVRFGSKADIGSPLSDVRFTTQSGHPVLAAIWPLIA